MSIYNNITDFLNNIADNGSLLGLDFGHKRIGVALSDKNRIIATPFTSLVNKHSIVALNIFNLYKDNNCSGVIIGLPINMNNQHGKSAQVTKQFADNLANFCLEQFVYNIPITFWDERLSTVAVEKMLINADVSRAKRTKIIDKIAASYILQGFLDRIKF